MVNCTPFTQLSDNTVFKQHLCLSHSYYLHVSILPVFLLSHGAAGFFVFFFLFVPRKYTDPCLARPHVNLLNAG